MDVRPITEDYSAAPQITPEDVTALAEAGYRSLICNRPDGEELGQPAFAEIETAAQAHGLEMRWIPVVGGPTAEAIAAFRSALEDMPKPVLAYCRSGTRSTMIWAIAQFGTMPDDEIVQAAARAGYDMAGLVAQLRQMQG